MQPFSAAVSNREPETIGEKLAAKRISLDIRQRELSQKFGVSQNKLSRIENGKQDADGELLEKIVEFIGDTVDLHGSETDAHEDPKEYREETPLEAARRICSDFGMLIDKQYVRTDSLDVAQERITEAFFWFRAHCESV